MARTRPSVAEVRRRLLSDPSLLDVREAALRILAKRERCSRAMAVHSLMEFREHVEVDRAFRFLLPEEWARQKGGVIQRRVNFFKAVSDLFPVDWDYLDMCYMETGDDEDVFGNRVSYFDYGIVIDSMRPFESWELEQKWDELPLSYQLADVLFGDNDPPDRSHKWVPGKKWDYLVSKGFADAPVKLVGEADRAALLSAFERARGPLRFVPWAHRVLTFNTGSVFYDYDPEDGIEPYEWSRWAIAFLTGQATIARRVEKDIKALDRWLAGSARARARKVINYYTKHRRIIGNEQKQRIRVGAAAADARALVNVL